MLRTLSILLLFFPLRSYSQNWTSVGNGFDGDVLSLINYNNDLYAGGNFSFSGSDTLNKIARWNGSAWVPLNNGVTSGGGYISSMIVFNNNLYVAGTITKVDSVDVDGIAKWNGSSWSNAGSTNLQVIFTLAVYNGKLYAAGLNDISRLDGGTWNLIANVGLAGVVTTLKNINGELYAAGSFTSINGVPANNIAKWDGSSWSQLGSGTNDGILTVESFNGEILIGGVFNLAGGIPAEHIAKWNGSIWTALGSGTSDYVKSLIEYNSSLIVGGDFDLAGGHLVNNIAKWDGNVWSNIGSGSDSTVRCFAVIDSIIYSGGNFITIDSINANHIAKINGDNIGILDQDSNRELIVFPSPVQNTLYIENERMLIKEVTLYNLFSQVIRNFTIDGQSVIAVPMEDLCSGIYIIKVRSSYGSMSQKIILTR